jgi:SAM-dependent methyltransferase
MTTKAVRGPPARPSPAAPLRSEHGPHAHHADHGWSRERALAALESPERRRLLDPERFCEKIGLRPGAVLVDVGAGTGYFAIPAARRVGAEGKVYAVDVSDEMIRFLRDRRVERGLLQIEPVLSTPHRIPLPTGVADVVLFATVLHDISTPTVAEAVRLLRPGGILVNLDWKKEPTPFGPPFEIRLGPDQAEEVISRQGLSLVGSFDPGKYHYAQIFRSGRAPDATKAPDSRVADDGSISTPDRRPIPRPKR